MNAAVKDPLDQTAAQIRDAHKRATTLRNSIKTEGHPRNLAGLALVLLHERDAALTWQQMEISRTMGDQELLPAAPADREVLRKEWGDPAHCDQVIADKVARIRQIRDDQKQAIRERREGVAALALGRVTGEPVPPADIARKTGLTLQQIRADLKASRLGVPELAELLDVPEERVRAALDHAREAGIPWPEHETQPLLFDPALFRAWWDEHRFGWLTADQHAADLGADPAEVGRLLEIAEEIEDLPKHTDQAGQRLFDPESFRAWWASRVRDQEELDEGWAGATALAYLEREPVLVMFTRLSEAKKARRLPEHRQGTRGRLYNVQAVKEFFAQRGRPEDDRYAPVSELADLVGQAEHVVARWLREAEQRRGLELPPYEERPGRRRYYDVQAFPDWWARTWQASQAGAYSTLDELAHLAGTTVQDMRREMRLAAKRGIVMPPSTTVDGQDRYETKEFLTWWECLLAGNAAEGRRRYLTVTALAAELGLPAVKVTRQVKAALERGRVLPPHRVNERGHREFDPAAYRAWRALVEK